MRYATIKELQPGKYCTFKYYAGPFSNNSEKELISRDNKQVIVVRQLQVPNEADIEIGRMYVIRFDDGFIADAFTDELRVD